MNSQEEIKALRDRLDKHLESYQADTVKYTERQLRQDIAHAQSMEAIDKLTKATQGVVDAWVIANGFSRFLKFLSSFVILGGILTWIATKITPEIFK